MYAAFSLLVIAVGAIMKWGIADHVSGANFNMIGLILILVGLVGLVIAAVNAIADRRRIGEREYVGTRTGGRERIRQY
jgi:hypothetical protein